MFNSVASWFGGPITPDGAKEYRKSDIATPEDEEQIQSEDKNEGKVEVNTTKRRSDAVNSQNCDVANNETDSDSTDVLEDVSAKAYDTAKAWGSYLYSVSKTATKTVAKTAMQLKDKVEETAPLIGDFSKEQKKFKEENREAKKQIEAAVPPWVGYNEEAAMREQILALSLDRRNFLRNPPAGVPFHFDFAALHPVAIATLQEDPNLATMRFDLVPKCTREENFWRNYFYRVSLIKQSTQLTTMAQQTGSIGESTKRSPDDNGQRDTGRMEALESPLGSPPEHEFVSDAFQNSDVNEDDIRKEMEQMRITNQQQKQSPAQRNTSTDVNIPEWERELQQELQEYDMMDDGSADDADIESEILKQLEQETEADEETQ